MDSEDEFVMNDSGNESDDSDSDDVELSPEGMLEPRQDRMDIEDSSFEVLSTEQVVQFMNDNIADVTSVVEIPKTITRILLQHLNWDKEKLMEKYFDGDQEKLFREAHVINPFRKTRLLPDRGNGKEKCEICMEDTPSSAMTGIECGHRFCSKCWVVYLTAKITEDGVGASISCAGHACDILVDDETVMRLLGDPKVKIKYQHLITNSFVECNRLLRWCPKPECNYCIKSSTYESQLVKCRCGQMFCFLCCQDWHEPVNCALLKKWKKKCDDDSETSNWIAANTKECPKCAATIEKDGGCNHMVCKKTSCRHEFCWVCLGPWEPHGASWYNCNRFNEDSAKAARTQQETSRGALQRYLFYYSRYSNHTTSLRFETKLHSAVKDKMEEMQQHGMSWIEVQFLRKAVDILCQCRQTLMYTYVFAFYLQKTNQSVIFEHNQKDLENATEELSAYLERDIAKENLTEIKQNVQDKSRYCDGRRAVLVNHVYEGYDKDWWMYTD
ncbi:unnamed protein product [Notodromas monacha]|uniref:RBR-type E3 ubiquitin transferase n=1 Tax=Notodromas monacha TaxID=399045 RepID=A0A7R9GF75_9CRUS|nr:unnamed protein product [Notodromas monacha]CAG0919057.1 unnamed protein product [Notodromas monacha]